MLRNCLKTSAISLLNKPTSLKRYKDMGFAKRRKTHNDTMKYFAPSSSSFRVKTSLNSRLNLQSLSKSTIEGDGDDSESEVDYHKRLKPLKFDLLNIPSKRKVIIRRLHNFKAGMGEHLVEISF